MSPNFLCRSPRFSSPGLLTLGFLLLTFCPHLPAAEWPQWGGEGRDFHSPEVGLVPWPEEGPKVLWSEPLGLGFSAIAALDGKLYTLYREGEEEVVVSFDAARGGRLWSHRYAVDLPPDMRLGYGSGPHSTPLLTAGKVYTIGTAGQLWALDAATGKPLWHHDLWKEYGGSLLLRGYGSSPIAFDDTILVMVGGEGSGLMAFSQDDGRVVWKQQTFFNSQSSPLLIDVEGQLQLVAFVKDEILAVDPRTGALRWRHPHPSTAAYNISTPIWNAQDQLLFVSSAYGGGSRVLHLSTRDGQAVVEELWANSKLKVHYTNAVRLGDVVYGSHGNAGAVYSLALQVKTGEMAWRDRAVKRANFVAVGEQVLMLESEGRLVLARLTPEQMTILAQFQLFEGKSWTVPTVVGHRLFARDEERITALELPVAPGADSPQDSVPR